MLLGSRAEVVVEDMKRCGRSIAVAEADKESLMHEVDDLE